jgi:hypothetical protein
VTAENEELGSLFHARYSRNQMRYIGGVFGTYGGGYR